MIPSKLKIKNFFSHKYSEVDFSNFNSALLIGNTEGDYDKSNGSGKSAIFEAVLWCLFNKSRASMMDDIIRWGEKTCSVDLEFIHNGDRYMVSRTRNRMNSTSTVEFYSMSKDGEWTNISGSTSGDTNSRIEETIKLDHKTFINSVYFRQNDISEFAESEPSKKKEILKSIVDISRWDEYEKRARGRVKEIKLECKVLKGTVEDYDKVVDKLEEVSGQIASAENSASSLKSSLETLNDEISSLEEKYLSIKESLDTDAYDRIVEDLKRLKGRKIEVETKVSMTKESLDSFYKDKEKFEQIIEKIDYSIGDKVIIPVEDGAIDSLRDQLVEYKSSKSSSEEVLKTLAEKEILSGECYVCHQEIDDELYHRIKHDHEEREELYKKRLSDSTKMILKIESELEALIATEKTNKKINDLMAKRENCQYKLEITNDSIKKEEEALRSSEDRLSQITFKMNNNIETLQSIKNDDFQALRKKIKELSTSRDDTKVLVSENDKKLGRLLERQSVLAQRELKMRADKKKINQKLQKVSLFEKLGKMFGKSGIQTILLDFVIEDLEKTANNILSSICNEPSVIVLETQRLGSDGVSLIETLDLKVRKDGHLQNFKSLSGGEKFRISLALRVALSEISSRYGGSSLEFLLLDEVNSPLDRYGVETLFVSVIKSLEDRYKILVITHDESLKEKFDNVINITKVNGESELEFIRR